MLPKILRPVLHQCTAYRTLSISTKAYIVARRQMHGASAAVLFVSGLSFQEPMHHVNFASASHVKVSMTPIHILKFLKLYLGRLAC